MKSIFILGASSLQIPAIKKAKERGLFVYTLDYDSNASGIKYADKFLEISTLDKEAIYEAAIEYNPDYIITSTSDMPVRTVSWVCEKLGKETDISYQGAIYATDKGEMRKRMKECGVKIPDFRIINSYDEFLECVSEMPDRFILKPADNSASRGVVLVDKRKDDNYLTLYSYCLQYSRNKKVLIEEYMTGPEVSVECFTVNGETSVITITDKIVSEIPYFVELGHTEPSSLSKDIQDDIINVAMDAIKAIGIKNGPSHTEIKVTPNGAKLVEVAARLGGDYITSKLVPLSTGIDMIDCSYDILLNKNVNLKKTKSIGAAIRFIHGNDGVLKKINGINNVKKMPGIQEVCIYKKVGDVINSPKNSGDRVGHVITIGLNSIEAAYNAEEAIKEIIIDYE